MTLHDSFRSSSPPSVHSSCGPSWHLFCISTSSCSSCAHRLDLIRSHSKGVLCTEENAFVLLVLPVCHSLFGSFSSGPWILSASFKQAALILCATSQILPTLANTGTDNLKVSSSPDGFTSCSKCRMCQSLACPIVNF